MGARTTDERAIPLVTGRVVEVGRTADGKWSEAILDIGRGQQIIISGLSDTAAKALAANLYKPATLEISIHEE